MQHPVDQSDQRRTYLRPSARHEVAPAHSTGACDVRRNSVVLSQLRSARARNAREVFVRGPNEGSSELVSDGGGWRAMQRATRVWGGPRRGCCRGRSAVLCGRGCGQIFRLFRIESRCWCCWRSRYCRGRGLRCRRSRSRSQNRTLPTSREQPRLTDQSHKKSEYCSRVPVRRGVVGWVWRYPGTLTSRRPYRPCRPCRPCRHPCRRVRRRRRRRRRRPVRRTGRPRR